MERGTETGFRDKNDQAIHVDDIVQYKLGKFGKASGGPRNSRVINFHGKFQLVDEACSDAKYGGRKLDEKTCAYLVVLRCNHMPT